MSSLFNHTYHSLRRQAPPRHRPTRPAFTLLEMIVVVIVIALLSALAVPTFLQVIDQAEFQAHISRDEAMARRIAIGVRLDPDRPYEDIVAEAAAEIDLNALAFTGIVAAAAGDEGGGSTPPDGMDASGWTALRYVPTANPSATKGAEEAWRDLASSVDESNDQYTASPTELAWTYDDYTIRTATRHDVERVVYCQVAIEPLYSRCATVTTPLAETTPPGFPITATGDDTIIDVSWEAHTGVASYRVRCWTANLPAAGDTPKVVASTGSGTQSTTVSGVENFTEHTCEVDALTDSGDVTSSPDTAIPFTGPVLTPPPPGKGPPSQPPEGPEPDPPTTTPPDPATCLSSPTPECLTPTSELVGLTSFVSTHAGTHRVYTVDRSVSKLRVVTDSASRMSSAHNISIVDATNTAVDLSVATDLVAGRHPARVHPQGTSPWTVMYASTSAGDIWLISPISGSATWRGYKVASGLGAISSLAFDNCPSAPGSSSRNAASSCVFATTPAGVVTVPMTSSSEVAVETPWSPVAPTSAVGLASNTADGAATDGDGAFWSTSGTVVSRTNWNGSANAVAQTGTVMSAPAGIAWLDDNFYIADPGSRKLFKMTPSGVRSVVAGSGTAAAFDGTGTAASFANPTRVHWHGTANVLYVLDGACVRKVNVSSGSVSTLVCPAQVNPNPVWRAMDGALASYANDPVSNVSMTADGKKMVYATSRTDLIPEDTTSDSDIVIRDVDTGEYTLVTTGNNGSLTTGRDPHISGDGSTVTYLDLGSDYLMVHDVASGTSTNIFFYYWGVTPAPLSFDGNKLAFASQGVPSGFSGDSNSDTDVYVYDVANDTFARASTATGGGQGNTTTGHGCGIRDISGDGNRVSFTCGFTSPSLITPDTAGTSGTLYVKDLAADVTYRASESALGVQAASAGSGGRLSYDGSKIVFSSSSTTLVPDDTNGVSDSFVKTVSTGEVLRITDESGAQIPTGTSNATFDQNKPEEVAFVTSTVLLPGDASSLDVYIKNTSTSKLRLVTERANQSYAYARNGFYELEVSGNTVYFRLRYYSIYFTSYREL